MLESQSKIVRAPDTAKDLLTVELNAKSAARDKVVAGLSSADKQTYAAECKAYAFNWAAHEKSRGIDGVASVPAPEIPAIIKHVDAKADSIYAAARKQVLDGLSAEERTKLKTEQDSLERYKKDPLSNPYPAQTETIAVESRVAQTIKSMPVLPQPGVASLPPPDMTVAKITERIMNSDAMVDRIIQLRPMYEGMTLSPTACASLEKFGAMVGLEKPEAFSTHLNQKVLSAMKGTDYEKFVYGQMILEKVIEMADKNTTTAVKERLGQTLTSEDKANRENFDNFARIAAVDPGMSEFFSKNEALRRRTAVAN